MNEIHRRLFVCCPIGEAAECLDTFFRERADAHGTVRFAIRACVHLPSLSADIALQRDVVVRIHAGPTQTPGARFSVDWLPADGGPFPRFRGALAVVSGDGNDTLSLVIDGSYESPPGSGAQSSEGIAHRIAQATARDFLGRVRDDIEGSYRVLKATRLSRAGLR